MKPPQILALGEPLIEMIRLPDPVDSKPAYQQGVGGDVLNAMVAVARQGGSAGLITAVGDDPFGRAILSFCNVEGIDTSAVQIRAEDPTGVCFIDPDPADRSFTYARRGSAASLYDIPDLPEAAIAAARVLHVSAVSQAISATMREAVTRAAEIARDNDTLVSYDLNLRLSLWSLADAQACIEGFLPFADIVFPSDDEASVLTGTDDRQAMIAHFSRHGARIVALKRGAAGVELFDGMTTQTYSAPKVYAVDSAGAGDSFAGAFLTHFLETHDPATAAMAACEVAARTVTGLGATGAIPHRRS